MPRHHVIAFSIITLLHPWLARADGPDLWMGVMEPIWRGIKGWPPSDFSSISNSGTDWQSVLSSLRVFQFSEKYAARGDLQELTSTIKILQSHSVNIGILGVALTATTKCGLGVEGFGTEDETARAGARLRQAGANVSYITFDEPLYFGHFFKGGKHTTGCQLSIPGMLAQIAQREKLLRGVFPGVKIGDVEPFGLNDVTPEQWAATYAAWLGAYRGSARHDWDYIQADIVWTRPSWKPSFLGALKSISDRHIPLGVYYTGSAADVTDAMWAASVEHDFRQLEGDMHIIPQQAIIASWTDHPRRLFPETDSTTMTGVALQYYRWQHDTH